MVPQERVSDRHLPQYTAHFIGREAELDEIAGLLRDPACRLLTLVGPGGIGKTRLAVEVTAQQGDQFADGSYFVALQPLERAENIAPAIASAINLQLHSTSPPKQQLLNFLHDRQLLLVMDNFEHLLDGVDLLAEISSEAPQVKILVTSRESLKLTDEWVWQVTGMPVPEGEIIDRIDDYSAVTLFIDRAMRVRRDFSLADEQSSAIEICRLVEGNPLAIELAATWAKTLPCADIAAEIRSSLGFLTDPRRDVPDRHRSMRAVFDWSWQLMSSEEREAFAKLSVFRGGFTREAAEQVAGASLMTLARLVDQSLLRRLPSGRYDLHQLLREYAAGLLNADPVALEHSNDRHCSYYAQFVADRVYEIVYGDPQEALVEIDNLRAAWGWAIDHRRLTEISQMTEGLSWLFPDRMGLPGEARAQFERAATALAMAEPAGEPGIVYGQVLAALAVAEFDCGHGDRGKPLMRTAVDILRRLDTPGPVLAFGLCFASLMVDDFDKRIPMEEEYLAFARELGEPWRVARALIRLANWSFFDLKFDEAQSYMQQILVIGQEIGSSILKALALSRLGWIACQLGDYERARPFLETAIPLFGNSHLYQQHTCLWLLGIIHYQQRRYAEAEQYYRRSLARMEAIDRRHLKIAWSLIGLALVAATRGDHAEAQRLAEECIAIYQEQGESEGVHNALLSMGYLAAERGDPDEAARCYLEVLRLTQEDGITALTREAIMGFAGLIARSGDQARAVELLALALPEQWNTIDGPERRPLYYHLRDDLEASMESASFQVAWARGKQLDLEATLSQLITRFSSHVDDRSRANDALPEPLTPRECEVLALLGEGLTNPQIAERLFVTTGAIKRYTSNIYGKLAVENRVQAVSYAREIGLI